MKITAVIPTYNRRDSLACCLETLFEQDFPAGQSEIVVVVDGSSDGTSEMLSSFRSRGGLVVIEQENRGQTAALNAGAKAATGELILFLDDDLLCDRALFSEHLAAHAQRAGLSGQALVFGRMRGILGNPASPVERWSCENLDRYYERLAKDARPKWPDDAWAGPNCSLPRSLFLEAGGYDERLFPRRGEDVDLGLRLWKMGIRFQFNPRAITSHRWVKPDWQILADDESDGASKVRLCRKHPEYRSHSGLAGVMSAPWWKRLAMRAAAGRPAIAGALLRALNTLMERAAGRTWKQRRGVRLFLARQAIATVAGARREAGSWQELTELFGRHMAVLLYHHVGPPTPKTKYLSLTVLPAQFLRHVRWLRRRGYTPITPCQWLSWCTAGGSLPRKPVLLTFDDAYSDIAEYALPVLERYGFPSAVFVITRQAGAVTTWDGLPIMTMEQIRHWSARGVEIGAHTRTHPELTAVSDETVVEEVGGSKEDLKAAGVPPLSFAYPYGGFDDRVRALVDGVFPVAFTCEEGVNSLGTDRLLLKRTMVQPGDTLLDIELRAAFGRSPLNRLRSRLRVRSRFLKILRYLKFLPS